MIQLEYEDTTLTFYNEDYYEIICFTDNVPADYEYIISLGDYDLSIVGV
jgi:hypothetical protein